MRTSGPLKRWRWLQGDLARGNRKLRRENVEINKKGKERKVNKESAIKAKESAIKAHKVKHTAVACDSSSSSGDVEITCSSSIDDSDVEEVPLKRRKVIKAEVKVEEKDILDPRGEEMFDPPFNTTSVISTMGSS